MATALASSIRIEATLIPSSHLKQVACRFSGLKALSFNPQKRVFPALQLASSASSASRVFCAANPETLKKVCDVVNKQLALPGDASVTPESNFSTLGADSLDKMEIVMALEEEFEITLGEEDSGTITTVQEAVDLIDSHLQKVVCSA